MRIVKRVVLIVVILAVVLIAVLGFIGWRMNRPAKVPPDFVPPTEAPADTAGATEGTAPAVGGSVSLGGGEIVFASNRNGSYEIFVMAADGSNVRALTDDPATDAWWPRPSPDRRTILFNRSPAGVHDRDATKVSLWLMNADGSSETMLRPAGLDGWVQQGHAEWSPDGRSMVMFGGSRFNPQIYLTNSVGQEPRKLTDRGGTNIDPSFSPDGATVVFVGCPRSICNPGDYEIYAVPAGGGDVVRITDDKIRDQDPYVSPDGTTLAWLSQTVPGSGSDPLGVWDVRLSNMKGEGIRLLTNDNNVTSRPIWAADGRSVLVHRLEKGKDTAFQIFRISVDGTSIQRLTSGPAANEYPG